MRYYVVQSTEPVPTGLIKNELVMCLPKGAVVTEIAPYIVHAWPKEYREAARLVEVLDGEPEDKP